MHPPAISRSSRLGYFSSRCRSCRRADMRTWRWRRRVLFVCVSDGGRRRSSSRAAPLGEARGAVLVAIGLPVIFLARHYWGASSGVVMVLIGVLWLIVLAR